jgi:Arylmalonate decarboxylase
MTNSTSGTQDACRSFFGHIGGAAVLGLASLAPKRLYAQTQAPAARPDGPNRLGGSAAADSSARSAEMRRAPDYQELLKKGYGHIGRVGFLSPGIIDETLSGQFYRMAPPGVTLVQTSLELKDVTIDEVNAALARTEKAAAELGKYRPDCIVFGGSPTVAVPGHGSDKVIVERIERASGRRAFAAQAAAIEALQRYGAKKLALATPFPDNVNALVKDFLEKSGFEILSIRGFRCRLCRPQPNAPANELGAGKTSIRASPACRRSVLSGRSTAVRRHRRAAREGAWHIRHLQLASFLVEGAADPQTSSSCGMLRPAPSRPRLARIGWTSATSGYLEIDRFVGWFLLPPAAGLAQARRDSPAARGQNPCVVHRGR